MKIVRVLLSAVCLVLFTLLVVHCAKKDDPIVPDPPAPVTPMSLSAKTSIIKESDTTKVLAYDTLTNVLELSGDINLASVEVGSVIVSPPGSNAPNGFLVKVVEVLEKGTTIRVKTTPVFLEEAFESLEYSEEFTLSAIESNQRSSAGTIFSIDQSVDLVENGVAKLAFKSAFEPKFKFEIKIENKQIKKLSLTLVSDFNTQVTFTSGFEGNISLLKNVLHKRMQNILLWIPTPIPFPLLIGSYLTFDVQASGSVTAFETSLSTKISTNNKVTYSGSWNNSNTLTSTTTFTPVDLELKGELELSAVPGLKLRFYNSDHAYGRLTFPVGLTFNYDELSNPDKRLSLHLKAKAMMHISNIIDYDTELGAKFEKLLWADYFAVKKKEGDQNEFEVGVPLDTLLTVLVTDSSNNPREGVIVAFKPEGGTTFTATTDAEGLAKYAYVPTKPEEIKIYYELADVANEDNSKPTGSPNYFKLEEINLLKGNWKAVNIPGEVIGGFKSEYYVSECPTTRTGSRRIDVYTLKITGDSIYNHLSETITNSYNWSGSDCSTIVVDETLRKLSGTYGYKYVQSGNTLTVNDEYGSAGIQIILLDQTHLTLKYMSGDGDILEYGEVQMERVLP